ncbi:hypothetical protein LEP1GSC198_1389 [Leptospira kirschneri str. JB]|nr:hypothetical protein LEP1GSC198_1389 [Leptospira kirschneri str. JB]
MRFESLNAIRRARVQLSSIWILKSSSTCEVDYGSLWIAFYNKLNSM